MYDYPTAMFSEPLPNTELATLLASMGDSKRDPNGNRRLAYAVVTTWEVLEAQPLPHPGRLLRRLNYAALTEPYTLAEAGQYLHKLQVCLLDCPFSMTEIVWKNKGF